MNSFRGVKIGRTYNYHYFCKSRSFKTNFNNAKFYNVNFRGSILTSCYFKKTTFIGVDFLGTNLRRSNFEGAKFNNVIFVGALLDGCNFRNAKFKDCVFVNTSFHNVKNLDLSSGVTILKQYPKVNISRQLEEVLNLLKDNENIFNYRILHLSTKKFNHLSLKILLEKFPEHKLIRGLVKANERKDLKFPTLYSLETYLRNYLKM